VIALGIRVEFNALVGRLVGQLIGQLVGLVRVCIGSAGLGGLGIAS
jgi:hypothetical protein